MNNACDAPSPCNDADIAAATRALRDGKAVVFPTDTVYGLGVSVEHARSPQAIYDIKKRAAGKPVAWLVGSPDALDEYGRDVPERARELARAHWPGALTIIVKANDKVPAAFCALTGTIGLRMPASETALSLIRAVGSPLATSSANISGEGDVASPGELDASLLEHVSAVVQGEQEGSGVASTVIDCSTGEVAVVRQGAIRI